MLPSSCFKHCKNSPGSSGECTLKCQMAANTLPSNLGCKSTIRLLWSTSTIAIFIITQPESWHLFYHPTESGRLSRTRHCRKGVAAHAYHNCCHDVCHCQVCHCDLLGEWVWPTCPTLLPDSVGFKPTTAELLSSHHMICYYWTVLFGSMLYVFFCPFYNNMPPYCICICDKFDVLLNTLSDCGGVQHAHQVTVISLWWNPCQTWQFLECQYHETSCTTLCGNLVCCWCFVVLCHYVLS